MSDIETIKALQVENAKLRADKVVLLDRVVAFVGQLQAWGYDAAAVEIYAEIVSGPVIAPDYYALQSENARLRLVAAAADALAQYLRKGIPQAPREDIHISNIENNARLRYLDTRRVLAYAQAVENALAASEGI